MALPHMPVWAHLYKRWDVEKPCVVKQYSDLMICETCDITWDAGDPEPPRCPHDIEERAGPVVAFMAWMLAAVAGVACWWGLLRLFGV